MKVLLLNKNPIISKLVRLSAEKLNYDFEEQEAYDKKMTGYYEFIIVDNEIKADLKNLENRCKKLICLSSKNSNIQDNIQILHKPFLPTDLISLIKVEEEPKEETPPETEPTKEVEKEAEDTTQEELADLDLDSLDLADEDTPKKHIEGAKEGFEEADIDNIFNNEDKLKIKPPNKEYVQDLVDDPLNLENETSNLSNTKNEADKTAKAQDSSPEKAQASKEDLNSAKSEEGLDLSELNLDELEKNLNEPLKEEAKNSASDLNLDKVSSEDLNLDLQEKASSEEGLKEGLNEDLNLDSVKEDVKASSEDLASLEKTVLKDEEVANVVEDLNEDLNLDLSEGDLNSKEGAKEGLNEDLNSGSSSKEGLNEDLNLDLNEESLKEGLNDDLNLEDLNSKLAKQDPSLEDTKSTNQATQPTKEPDPSLEFKEEDLLLSEDLKEENSAKELEELKIDELSLQEELNLQEGLNLKEDLDQKLNLAELQEDLTNTEASAKTKDKNNDEIELDEELGFDEKDLEDIMGKSDLETENMKDSSLNLENTDPQGLTPTSKANNTAQTPGTQEQAKEISSEDQKPTQELALKDELNLTEFEKSLIKPLQEKLKNSANDLNLEKNSSEDLNLNINSQDELNLEKVSANDLNLDTNLSEDLNLDSVKEDVKTSSEEASLEKTVSKEAANLAEDLNEDLNLQLSEGDLNSKADSTEGLNEDLNSGSSSKEGLNEDLNLDLNEESLKEGLNDDLNLEDLNSKLAKQDPSLEDTKSTNQATQPTKEPDPSLEFKEEDLLLNEDLKEENSAKELEELKIDELSLQEELNLQEGLNSKEDLDQKLNLAELQEDLTDTEANDKNNDEMGLDGVEAIKDLIDEEPNKQEEELIDPSLSTEDEAKQIKASESIKDLIDEEPNKQEEELTVEEVPLNQDLKEDRLSFDDLPRDAKFIGQNKETPQLDELTPTVEEPQEPQTEELSTHDKIKNELAILNEMDKMEAKEEESLKDEPSEDKQAKIIKTLEEVNEAPLRMQRISAINLEEDLAQLNERDIQIALKEVPTQDEETQPPPQSTQDLQEKSAQNEEIIDELSKGIAGAITSSIKDDALKAALKGMNMHIDINIKFEEDKQ